MNHLFKYSTFPHLCRNGSIWFFCKVFAIFPHVYICIGKWKLPFALNIDNSGSVVSLPPLIILFHYQGSCMDKLDNAVLLRLVSTSLNGQNEVYLYQPLWWSETFPGISGFGSRILINFQWPAEAPPRLGWAETHKHSYTNPKDEQLIGKALKYTKEHTWVCRGEIMTSNVHFWRII